MRESVHIRGISNFMLVANAKSEHRSVEFKIILVEGMLIQSISEAYLTLCWWRTRNRSIASVEFKIILVEGMLISPYPRHI